MKVWVCQVRHEAFVGGESQRCRHTDPCDACNGTGKEWASIDRIFEKCSHCRGTGKRCGEMELIGGEPIEWCVVHGASQLPAASTCWYREAWGYEKNGPCQFESNVRVKVAE